MTRKRLVGLCLLTLFVWILAMSIIVGWPWAHQFHTYTWPGPAGWVARETPGNIVAGFIQVSLGFLAGYGAHRLGVFETVKNWLFKEAHEERERAKEHDKWVAGVIASMHREVTGEDAAPHPEHGSL